MRGWRVLGASLAVALVTSCSIEETPLPGGADLGSSPYRVTVRFADVLDLVPNAAVRVNDVPVGKVEEVGLSKDNATALVTVRVNGSVDLPANSYARIRQSSLLGEKFVELARPEKAQQGSLEQAANIPLSRTNRNPQVEEVLGALSLLLNGGGVEQLQTIVSEFNNTLSGNESQIRDLLYRLQRYAEFMDAQRADITRAIDGLDRLSTTLRAETAHIQQALDQIGPGLDVIERQRDDLVQMLGSLDRLSDVAGTTIERSKEDMVSNLRALQPVLQKLNEVGAELPDAINFLASYPFPNRVMEALKGDYVNLDLQIDLDPGRLIGNLKRSSGPLLPIPGYNDAGERAIPRQGASADDGASSEEWKPPALDESEEETRSQVADDWTLPLVDEPGGGEPPGGSSGGT